MNRFGLFVAAAALFVTAAPALAEPVVSRILVPTRDLDLSSAEGTATLKSRVSRAVRQVCGGGGSSLHEKVQQRSCIRTAGRQAEADVARSIAASRQFRWSSDTFRRTGPVH